MRASVRAAFVAFTEPLEGKVDHFYQDVRGLITIAIGNLVDPLAYAMVLPMVDRVTGARASRDEIAREWQRVKADASLARLGHRAAAQVTRLKLTEEGIQGLVLSKLDEMDRALLGRFPSWEAQPADGQLLVLSMSWALGPHFRFPKFEEAFRRGDYRACADECKMSEEGNAGVRPRNAANRLLALNAANVVECDGDYGTLWWPRKAENERKTVPQFLNESEGPEPLLAGEASEGSLPITEDDGGAARWAATRDSLYEK
jgi:hypothetical protein